MPVSSFMRIIILEVRQWKALLDRSVERGQGSDTWETWVRDCEDQLPLRSDWRKREPGRQNEIALLLPFYSLGT